MVTQQKLTSPGREALPYPPYYTDIALPNFHRYQLLQNLMTTISKFNSKQATFFQEGINRLEHGGRL